jgi:DNA-binding transcriptional LysR family regulator
VQPALSASVRNLERELGAGLFDRTGRRVVLTEAGRALLPQARALLAGAEEARQAVAAVTGLAVGRVAIGTIQTLTCVDLPAELATFHRRFPGVQVSVRDAPVGELAEALRAGELDLAHLVPDAGTLPEGLTPYASWEEELVLITAPGPPRRGRADADQGSRRGAVRRLPRGDRTGDGGTASGGALRSGAPYHL